MNIENQMNMIKDKSINKKSLKVLVNITPKNK